jgi:hypothetical protein
MKKIFYIAFASILILSSISPALAQNKVKRIGNKPRSGSAKSSFSVVKGEQVGVVMRAGRKPVQLLQLNFDAESEGADSLVFKVNVYKIDDGKPGKNLVQQPIFGSLPKGKNRVSVDLSKYNVVADGIILVAIEWVKTSPADNQFAVGLFNGGTWYYRNHEWKHVPIVGADFNVMVRRV